MLAIVGGKGGTGKTTTTLGLAAALARQRRRPLAVEADCAMPNLAVKAGVAADDALSKVARGGEPADLAQRSPSVPGVDVLPATPGAAVRRGLDRLAASPRPVLVDCPAGASESVAAPLRAADGALVVTTLHPPAVGDAMKTAAMARAVGTAVVGVVATRTSAGPDRLRDAFDVPVSIAVPTAAGRVLADPAVRAAYDRLAGAVATDATSHGPGPDAGTERGDGWSEAPQADESMRHRPTTGRSDLV